MSKVPAEILDEKSQDFLKKWFFQSQKPGSIVTKIKGETLPPIYVFGKGKQLLSPYYYEHKDYIKNIEIREDDVWIFGFPRSGTTLTQEMVWLLDHNLDFETAKKVKVNYRCVMMDTAFSIPQGALQELKPKLDAEGFDYLDKEKQMNRPSPRHFKTHHFFELFPDNLVDKAKVFYIAREIKDVIVSKYHYDKLSINFDASVDFKKYCLYFIEDQVINGPYFTHLKEGWSKRNHPNVMFMFYEDIIRDLPGTIRRVSKFLGKDYSEEQLEQLHQHLSFDNMKKNDAVTPIIFGRTEYGSKDAQPFIRKGKSGTWREYFDDELLEKTEAWIAKNLAGTDIKYPPHINTN